MDKIRLDENTSRRLSESQEHIAVCDSAGKTIGHLVPEAEYDRLIWAWATSTVDSSVEFARVKEEYRKLGGMPTKEAIAFIQKFGNEHAP